MFCQECGVTLDESTKFCTTCGAPSSINPVYQPPQYQQQQQPQYQQTVVVMGNKKSAGLAFLLAFLFGPLGLLYASVVGGLVMICVGIIIFFLTAGLGEIFVWIVCIIWAIVAVNNENNNPAAGTNININPR